MQVIVSIHMNAIPLIRKIMKDFRPIDIITLSFPYLTIYRFVTPYTYHVYAEGAAYGQGDFKKMKNLVIANSRIIKQASFSLIAFDQDGNPWFLSECITVTFKF